MKLLFSYTLEKDIDNFLKAGKSVNSAKPTKLQGFYFEKFGEEITAENIKKCIEMYIKEQGIDIEMRMKQIRESWSEIEERFFKKTEAIFETAYPQENITVFLTTNGRCTYNIPEHYFFVNMMSEKPNAIIMHELLHFYTWHVFYKKLQGQGVSSQQYNDIKESLTELLNIEFADLMNGEEDKGYPQHQEMRKKVKEAWLKTRNITQVVGELL